MTFPDDRMYTRTHEWAKQEGELVRVGITEFAADQLGDIVYLDLPEVGKAIAQGDVLGEIESVKAVVELYAPVGGDVAEVSSSVLDDLDSIRRDPYREAWMVVIEAGDLTELSSLLDAATYEQLCTEEAGQ